MAGPPIELEASRVKGIIFNLAEEVVTVAHGEDVWDDVLDESGLEGAYTSLGSYDDAEFGSLVHAAARRLDADPNAVVRQIAEGAMPLLAARYPEFFAPHTSARAFVLTVNDIIHPEVRKLYPGALAPEFLFDATDPDVLVIGYDSARQMCALAEGFIVGAARHYGEMVEIEQPQCMLRGDAACRIRCRFSPIAVGASD